MTQNPPQSGTAWTKNEIQKLKSLAAKNVDTVIIAKELGRSINAIYNKASEEEISLKPKDK